MGSERSPREGHTTRRGHLQLALGTSIRDNSIAFGFSLTVTMSFSDRYEVQAVPSMITSGGACRGGRRAGKSPSWRTASRPGRWPPRRPRSCSC
jgi:hypothetical protein